MKTGKKAKGAAPKSASAQDGFARYEVPMVARALQVLEMVAQTGGQVALADVQKRTRITRSSAYRILYTLELHRYVTKDPNTGDVSVGPRLEELYRVGPSRASLEASAEPVLQALRARFDETVNLGVVRDKQLVYVRVVESHRQFRIRADEGTVVPWHASALGKAVLAFLPGPKVAELLAGHVFQVFTPHTPKSRTKLMEVLAQVRRKGVGRDDEEIELGASCMAAPIFNANKEPIAALSISGPTARIAPMREEVQKAILQAAAEISRST